MHDRDGRDALLTEVWGPKSMRKRLGEAAKAGATGGGAGALLDGCGSCDVGDLLSLDSLLVVIGLAITIGIVWFAYKLVRDFLRTRRHRLRANGARRRGPQLGPATGRVGTITRGEVATPPLGDRLGVAYAIELHSHDTLMLREAHTNGFDVALATGESVRVPPGPCVIDMTRAPRVSSADDYRDALDPLRQTTDDLEPFPYDRAHALVVERGATIEMLGRLVPTADGSGAALYRESAHTLLVPDGIPRFRLV